MTTWDATMETRMAEISAEISALSAAKDGIMEQIKNLGAERQEMIDLYWSEFEGDVTEPQNLRRLTRDAWNNSTAHNKQQGWIKALGAPELHPEGIFPDGEVPAASLWLTYRQEISDTLVDAVAKYTSVIDKAWKPGGKRPTDIHDRQIQDAVVVGVFTDSDRVYGRIQVIVRPSQNLAQVVRSTYRGEEVTGWLPLREALEALPEEYYWHGGPERDDDGY